MLNVKTLSAKELYQLANIIHSCKVKAEDSEKNLSKIVDKIKGMSEDSYALVWDKIPDSHFNLNSIMLPHQNFE